MSCADSAAPTPSKNGRDLFVGGQCHELDEFEPVSSIVREVGYPKEQNGGGVWVLGVAEDTGRFPGGVRIQKNALTMEGGCMYLDKWGAVYCGDVLDCSLLENVNKEPSAWARDE
ncbi:hypothetical protein BDV06DRAFT_228557 [Aspergillus oleicola]